MREHEEQWRRLCAEASVEQDPKKLNELAAEIMWLLEQKKQRLAAQRKATEDKSTS